MIAADFVVDPPILKKVLHASPSIEIRWEVTYTRPDGPVQLLVWITGDDFETVETALETDPSVRDSIMVADLGERRLYRVALTELGGEAALMPEFVEVGGILDEAIGTENGWWCRARFPDRAAFQRIHRFYRDQDIGFKFGRLVESSRRGSGSESGENSLPSMLTERQQEALRTAWEAGYFDIPRRVTLTELSQELGISDTAVSQRLRRAQATICAYFLGTNRASLAAPYQ